MANISAIKLPDGVTYDLVDRVSKDIFIAEYGVTSYSDVYDAHVAHKQIVLKYPSPHDYFYIPCSTFCSGVGSSIYLWFLFAWSVSDSLATCVELTSNNNWSANDMALQEELVSGTNIKTINGTTLLGSGDITVAAGGTSVPTADEVSEFDSDAHMNSTDMSDSDVSDFVDGLNVSGGGVVKTNVTPTSGTNYSGYGNCYYEVLGKLVHFHIGIGGLTANTSTKIYTMPSGLRPQTKIFAKGSGGSSLNYSGIELWDNGEIYVTSQGNYCGAELWYFV